jgi:hypothetical protein
MTIERQTIQATQGEKVRAQFTELTKAQAAVEQLEASGFSADQITLTTVGGHTEPDGRFVPGGISVVVLADDRADEAERILSAAVA